MTATTETVPAEVAAGADLYENPSIYTRPARRTFRMRKATWREHLARLGINSDTELGARLGFSPTAVFRIRTEDNAPSSDFMASASYLFDTPVEELFENVSSTRGPAKTPRRRAKPKSRQSRAA